MQEKSEKLQSNAYKKTGKETKRNYVKIVARIQTRMREQKTKGTIHENKQDWQQVGMKIVLK